MPRKRSSATAVRLPCRATGVPTVKFRNHSRPTAENGYQISSADRSEASWLPRRLDLPRSRSRCRPLRKATRTRSTPHLKVHNAKRTVKSDMRDAEEVLTDDFFINNVAFGHRLY